MNYLFPNTVSDHMIISLLDSTLGNITVLPTVYFNPKVGIIFFLPVAMVIYYKLLQNLCG